MLPCSGTLGRKNKHKTTKPGQITVHRVLPFALSLAITIRLARNVLLNPLFNLKLREATDCADCKVGVTRSGA
jgi:hypothetical protein